MTVDARPADATREASWLVATGSALAVVVAANVLAGQQRWWANFVLFPAAVATAAAVPLLAGRRERAAAGYVVVSVGVIVSTVGLLLLFGAMGRGWPLMIVLPCLSIAGTARWRAAEPIARAAHHTAIGLALLGALLGATFLAMDAGMVDFGDVRWWSYFMMAAGVIAIGNGLALIGDLRGYRLSMAVLLTGLGTGAVMAGIRELLWR